MQIPARCSWCDSETPEPAAGQVRRLTVILMPAPWGPFVACSGSCESGLLELARKTATAGPPRPVERVKGPG